MMNLPEDGVGAQPSIFKPRIKKGIDGREPQWGMVGDGNRDEFFLPPEFVKAGIDARRGEETDVLLLHGIGHAAVTVAGVDVALVEFELFISDFEGGGLLYIVIPLPVAALAAIGLELFDRYTHRDAGGALFAVGSVNMVAATAETDVEQITEQCWIDRKRRVDDQIARFMSWQIATGKWEGKETVNALFSAVAIHRWLF